MADRQKEAPRPDTQDEKKTVAPRKSGSDLLKKLDNHPADEFPESNN
jgi:hypothetical protein